MAELFNKIMKAHGRIRPQVLVTPLERSNLLSATLGCEVMLKCDHLQPTGSFKLRGATNKMFELTPEEREKGIITASTGNHGQAAARAGALAGVKVTVYVAASATQLKKNAIRALGAELVIIDGPVVEAELAARRDAAEQGKVYVSPYNDFDIVAGQGTLGVELFEQSPDLDAVFISVGCGGLMGGVGTALKQLSPQTRVVGVWAENSVAMLRSLEAGEIVEPEEFPTLAEGSAGAVEPGSVTFPICQAVIDDRVTVSEMEIAQGMRRVAEADRWMVEGSAGAAMAGLIKQAKTYKGKKVAVVLCGRNIALDTFMSAVGSVQIPS